mmetsp:Transcript_23399/g.54352  ORF Transcript_23399/g.54352 Transcript_23399/m.54352 type:complete len:139 (+) Transcript_23399:338-754(+)
MGCAALLHLSPSEFPSRKMDCGTQTSRDFLGRRRRHITHLMMVYPHEDVSALRTGTKRPRSPAAHVKQARHLCGDELSDADHRMRGTRLSPQSRISAQKVQSARWSPTVFSAHFSPPDSQNKNRIGTHHRYNIPRNHV